MRTPSGTVQSRMDNTVRLTILLRDCVIEVQEIPGNSPIHVLKLPLLQID